jgi:hypothetical protein
MIRNPSLGHFASKVMVCDLCRLDNQAEKHLMESRTQNLPRTADRPDSAKLPLVKKADIKKAPFETERSAKNKNSSPLLNVVGNNTGQNQSESVAERAYRMWEADGRPDGKDQEYWFRAESETKR